MFDALKKYWPVNLVAGCFAAIGAYCIALPNYRGFYEDSKIFSLFCSVFMGSSAIATGLFCRWKAKHQQRISYAIVLPAGFVVAVVTMMSGCFVVHGTRVFMVNYWQEWWTAWLRLWSLGFLVSLLVALAFVAYYKKLQRDNAHTA